MGGNQGLNQTTPVGWGSGTGPSRLGLCVPAGFEAGAGGQSPHKSRGPSVCRQSGVSCPAWGGGRGPSSDGLVEQRGDVLLLVAVRGAEHHHAVLREAQRQLEQAGAPRSPAAPPQQRDTPKEL